MIKINEEIANNCYLENQPLDVIMDAAEKRILSWHSMETVRNIRRSSRLC